MLKSIKTILHVSFMSGSFVLTILVDPYFDRSDEPVRKPVPLHEQTVKDEKGRFQRFHGAFTGGFSAGYFNTAGSKEGPSARSCISNRLN